MYMSKVFIFNWWAWWLVYLQDGWCIFQLCQIVCQCFTILPVIWVLHPWYCLILFFQWPDFQCAGSVHHTQCGQFCIQVSIWGPIFLVVYFWNRLCHLFWKMMVYYVWFSGQSWSNFHLVFSWQWLGLDSVLPGSVSQILGLLGIVKSVLEVGVKAGWGLFHRLDKMVFLLWQGLGLLCSLWGLDLCTCLSLLDSFHIVAWG